MSNCKWTTGELGRKNRYGIKVYSGESENYQCKNIVLTLNAALPSQ